ncbi:50S ribosomal protein L23 [bacterium CG_4_10_14_0_2_um_filter_33_32]|nr:MAG: 50S ribosomal protein L23 [bacterium CG2_30_33_46]PIR67360.1 MAG: 50S ribosomal protein L23 [bacterium CG10_big_fil_rev_8_21_14_0_10_33_18]PIU76747.1 MAG: 50S ribosomal protein L23 [bacterium CG06_land_8_20_14_3_00_33_50]PIW81307.1 MAG: 50S ribosomal protein L23 [bacterium CG_4_8_14_3_um_filter_33_28]PIY85704.1 MAG: 50S ribosomal protein L23 [bacterium CG_4_10_14_0_8_um_filter_33_57]PIZ86593.1 MAG: 50S ribosomal protein L23 [bacterium CG_4_10_14_0_2_um_filter_33_32]PJA72122.1 MAG: 50S
MKDILIQPIITEKSFNLSSQSKYVFEVGKDANKKEIGKAVADMYKVTVEKVNIVQKRHKTRRYGKTTGIKPGRKAAIVTVKKGQEIKLFEETK